MLAAQTPALKENVARATRSARRILPESEWMARRE
jgi:hypothetical protein